MISTVGHSICIWTMLLREMSFYLKLVICLELCAGKFSQSQAQGMLKDMYLLFGLKTPEEVTTVELLNCIYPSSLYITYPWPHLYAWLYLSDCTAWYSSPVIFLLVLIFEINYTIMDFINPELWMSFTNWQKMARGTFHSRHDEAVLILHPFHILYDTSSLRYEMSTAM